MPTAAHNFLCRGLDLAHPPDLLPDGRHPVLENVRVSSDGELVTREGLSLIASLGDTIHSLRRLNAPSGWIRVLVASTKLYTGQSSFTERDTGFSGKPVALLPFRPERSPDPWMYAADANKFVKVGPSGQVYGVGIAPPPEPVAGFAPKGISQFKVVSDFESSAGWTAGGTAGPPSSVSRINTTISSILYDSGNSGWASIRPAVMDGNFQPGAVINVGSEQAVIHEVFAPIANTTIDRIIYDSGSTGLCSVVLSAPGKLKPNALVQLGSEVVRVLSVHKGDKPSFRCSTASNHAAGETVAGLASFRVYLAGTYGAGAAITGAAIQTSVAKGTGTLTRSVSLDLSSVDGRLVEPDDYMHISLLVDDPSQIVEGRIMLDIDDGSFTKNYFYKPFRPSDLTPNVKGSLTATTVLQRVVQRQILDPSPYEYRDFYQDYPYSERTVEQVETVSAQIVRGDSQWTELVFKISELVRVGSNKSRSLRDVTAIRLELRTSGTVTLIADSWTVWGTYGPDVGATGSPVLYAYRYRSSSTGAKSNLSPVSRVGLAPRRDRLQISVTASSDPQVDRIDLFRFGGGDDTWRLVGVYPNQTATVYDTVPVSMIRSNEEGRFDDFRPFPVLDSPKSGTCMVAGTSVVWASGDQFDTRWAPGAQIAIGGSVFTIYAVRSAAFLELVESAGSHGNAQFSIAEPTLVGQTLPAVWMYGGQETGTYLFGVGDSKNPGTVRWTKGNDPDAASDEDYLEITSPSEPLMNGCEYAGQSVVLSTERVFGLRPDFARGGKFVAHVLLPGPGLFARYGLAATPYGLAWVSKRGIYLWGGAGDPKSITDDSLYPLFYGESVHGYLPVDLSDPDSIRLFYAWESLWFVYRDTGGAVRCMRFDFAHPGWFPYSFTPAGVCVYQEEGLVNSVLVGSSGLYLLDPSASSDDGTAISCRVRTPALDFGQPRAQKLFVEGALDFSGAASAVLYFNNFASSVSVGSLSSSGRGQVPIPVASLTTALYRNIALDLTWTGATRLYKAIFHAQLQPKSSTLFTSQATSHGFPGYSHVREAWVALISNDDVVFSITVDGVSYSYTVPSTGGAFRKVYLPLKPHKGKLFRYSASGSAFTLFGEDTVVHVKPWGTEGPYLPFKPFLEG